MGGRDVADSGKSKNVKMRLCRVRLSLAKMRYRKDADETRKNDREIEER